jgi:hypothetical protein
MFTSIDKALVAGFGAIAYLANALGGIDFGVSTETVGTLVALFTPILVYFVPNKPWTDK